MTTVLELRSVRGTGGELGAVGEHQAQEIGHGSSGTSTLGMLAIAVDRVRVVDAHPPREVVPAYRDVSAAVSDVERDTERRRCYGHAESER